MIVTKRNAHVKRRWQHHQWITRRRNAREIFTNVENVFSFALATLLKDKSTRNAFAKFVSQTRSLQRNLFDDYTNFAKNTENANLERRARRKDTTDFANRFVQHEERTVVNHTTKTIFDSSLFRDHREQDSRSIVEYRKRWFTNVHFLSRIIIRDVITSDECVAIMCSFFAEQKNEKHNIFEDSA